MPKTGYARRLVRAGEWGRGIPLPSRLGVWGSIISSPSGVLGRAPAKIEFCTIWMPKKPSDGMYCTEFCEQELTAIVSLLFKTTCTVTQVLKLTFLLLDHCETLFTTVTVMRISDHNESDYHKQTRRPTYVGIKCSSSEILLETRNAISSVSVSSILSLWTWSTAKWFSRSWVVEFRSTFLGGVMRRSCVPQ